MKTILTTTRLLLREFSTEDAAFIIKLVNSEGWLKYIGERNIKTNQQAIDYLLNGPVKSYETNGFGLWLVVLKSTNEPIGMCGLIRRDYLPNIDLGFAFLPEFTNKGYAYEIAENIVQYAFNQLQQKKILAITLPANASSIKLLEKLGFKYEDIYTNEHSNEVLSLYAISNAAG